MNKSTTPSTLVLVVSVFTCHFVACRRMEEETCKASRSVARAVSRSLARPQVDFGSHMYCVVPCMRHQQLAAAPRVGFRVKPAYSFRLISSQAHSRSILRPSGHTLSLPLSISIGFSLCNRHNLYLTLTLPLPQ